MSTGSNHIAWLTLFGTDSDPDAELLLRLTAAALGTELGREASYRGRKASFWDAALAGEFHDAAGAREEAASHGITVAPNYVAIALEAEAEADAPRP